MQRFDRGAVLAPPSGSVFEGVAGRVHAPGDALWYETGEEHRDASELAGIARQLGAGVPVTWTHPRGMPAAQHGAVIVGWTIGARVDGDHVVAQLRIDDQQALPLIRGGTKSLSLGYETDIIVRNGLKYQTQIRIDHLAIVPDARCGSACAMRADQLPRRDKMCSCSDNPERTDAPDREAQAQARMDAKRTSAWCKADSINAAPKPDPDPVDPDDDGPDSEPDDDRERTVQRRADARRTSAWRTLTGETGEMEG